LSFFERHRRDKCIDEYVSEILFLKGYDDDVGGAGGGGDAT
jgi:hypothetical protein